MFCGVKYANYINGLVSVKPNTAVPLLPQHIHTVIIQNLHSKNSTPSRKITRKFTNWKMRESESESRDYLVSLGSAHISAPYRIALFYDVYLTLPCISLLHENLHCIVLYFGRCNAAKPGKHHLFYTRVVPFLNAKTFLVSPPSGDLIKRAKLLSMSVGGPMLKCWYPHPRS
jgi:hypothetical protein